MSWPKLPNSKPYLDRGYTSIQMREYAMKCINKMVLEKESEFKFIGFYMGKPIYTKNENSSST